MLGELVGKYEITGELGKGGMGAVYVASHSIIGRRAAIKLLLPELSRNEAIVQRFFNEAKAATSIRHPGIVEIYDFGYHDDGSAYIVMEHLEGESMADRLKRTGGLAPSDAVYLVRHVASALIAAHDAGIIHRDLKPDNIFIVSDPDVPGGERTKLLDFGIAKLTEDDRATALKTQTGAIMGTPVYMSPEQCRGVANADGRTDLYALGCVLFELLTGRPPFHERALGELFAAHLYEPPPDPRSLRPDVPDGIAAVTLKLLEKDPANRFQSGRALAEKLDNLVGYAPARRAAARPATPLTLARSATSAVATTLSQSAGTLDTPTRPRLSERSRARLIALAAGTGIAIAAGIAIAVVGAGGDDRRPVANERPAAAQPQATAAEPPPPPAASPVISTIPPIDAGEVRQARIVLKTRPSGAAVFLGDQQLGRTPFEREFPIVDTNRAFALRLDGHAQASVALPGDRDVSQTIVLEPLARKRARGRAARRPAPTTKTVAEPQEREQTQPSPDAAPAPPASKPVRKKRVDLEAGDAIDPF